MTTNPTPNFVCVPISVSLYNELVIRVGNPDKNVNVFIENVVGDYLARTANDEGWSEQYYEWRDSVEDREAFVSEYGDPARGYHWGSLFLPNGTRISMDYKGRQYHAEVRHQQIHYEGKTYSPSELARVIASNTSRNAWRDLRIKRPSDQEWRLADALRRG